MYKRLKDGISHFFQIEQEDLSDRFMLIMLSVFIVFLFTQVIITLIMPFNGINTLLTIVSFLLLIIFFVLFKIQRYRLLSKILFVGVIHLLVFSFWITSEGVLGSISNIIPVVAFIVVAIMPQQYATRTLIFTFVFCIFMVSSEFFFPDLIVPYDTLIGKKIDIIIGIAFTFMVISFSFLYLRKEYNLKEMALKQEYEAQKKLNEELDNFVYRTSHDLRAPISSTLGLITLIRMSKNMDEVLRYAELQEKSLLKMDGFIHDILNYSQNNHIEVVREKISFQELYEDAIQQLYDSQVFSPVQTTLMFDERIDYFFDKLRLQTIFKNLISNALRYYDKQKKNPFLLIKIADEPDNIIITFEDNGIGIHVDSIPKIFDMFYRAHKSSVGSGVGLYIVKQSVEKIGGKICCISTDGVGTSFVITLPKK